MLIFLITLYKFAILHSVTSEEDLYKLNKLTKTTFFTRHFFQGFLPTDHIVGKLESAHVALLEYTLPSLYISIAVYCYHCYLSKNLFRGYIFVTSCRQMKIHLLTNYIIIKIVK